MTAHSEKSYRKLSANRKVFHDYTVLERFEAGIDLRGTEVKSIRTGHVSLTGGFARMQEGEVVLFGVNIPPYEHGNRFNHEAERPRRLLLHKREINRLQVQIEQKGYTLIPLSLYLKKGFIKIELGLCKGKHRGDKRETLRRRTAEREVARAIGRTA